ncbi:MAG: PHP domain-containing protein [Chlamydiae bacterium]|nr:PHP domain-containing protein [Chlamydiota bacterium]
MSFRADLHCHSSCSDGTDSPAELIDLAIEKGLSALSITDHDTVDAYEEALPYAKSRNFSLLVGVEFSSFFRSEPIHILGYNLSLKSEALAQLVLRHKKRRKQRNDRILEKLRHLGHEIELEETGHTIGRPHIAQALVKKGVVSSIEEAFVRLLGEGKPAYSPGEIISVEETIETIHKARGKAILAHPQLIKRQSIFRQMLEMPFDGLEGYYARMPREREQKYVAAAKERNWLITGGSDYHGTVKPMARLGSSWVDKETFDALSK